MKSAFYVQGNKNRMETLGIALRLIKQLKNKGLLLTIAFSTFANATDYFSKAECEYDGDGSSYGCAAAQGQVGAWRDLKISPAAEGMGAGDTWYACGYFGVDKRLNATFFIGADVGGAQGNPIRYTGDCTQFGGLGYATLDGGQFGFTADTQSGTKHGIKLTERSDYAVVDHFDIRNIFGEPNIGSGITFPSALGTGSSGISILYNKISNVGGQGIVTGGPDFKIMGNNIQQVGNDGIYVANGHALGKYGSAQGTAFGEISDNYVADVARNGLGGGDGIKVQNCTNVTGVENCHFLITRNTVYKTGTNKAAINVHGSGNGSIITHNKLYGFSFATNDEIGPVNFAALGEGSGSGDCNVASVGCLSEQSAGITLDGCGANQSSGNTSGIPEQVVAFNTIENFEGPGITFASILNLGIDGFCEISVFSNTINNIKSAAIKLNYSFPYTSFELFDNELGTHGDIPVGIQVEENVLGSNFDIYRNIISATSYNFEIPGLFNILDWNSDNNIFDSSSSGLFLTGSDELSFTEWQSVYSLDLNSSNLDLNAIQFNVPFPKVSYILLGLMLASVAYTARIISKTH